MHTRFVTWAMFAYLTATLIAAFDPPTDMEAMQILPESSWSATVRNLGWKHEISYQGIGSHS